MRREERTPSCFFEKRKILFHCSLASSRVPILCGRAVGRFAFRAAELLRGIETIESVFCVNDSEGLRKREGIQICRKKRRLYRMYGGNSGGGTLTKMRGFGCKSNPKNVSENQVRIPNPRKHTWKTACQQPPAQFCLSLTCAMRAQ